MTWFASYVLVYWVVARQKAKHVRAQNRLLERCRALFLVGTRHIERDDAASTEAILQRIRRIEAVWRFGNSPLVRAAVSLKAVAMATVCVAVVRFAPTLLSPEQQGAPFRPRTSDWLEKEVLLFLWAFVALPLIHALIANMLHDWSTLEFIDDCGDRLERLLRSPRTVAVAAKPERRASRRPLDGLTAHEILGVGRSYTRAEIKTARNRMAARFHPDVWATSSAADRIANEEAMKRVNAAYDELAAGLQRGRRPS